MRITPYNMQKAFRYLKHYGFREFLIRLREKQEPEQISYQEYYRAHKVTEKELARQQQESDKWADRPLIRYVMIRQESDLDMVRDMLCGEEGEYYAFVEEGDTLEPSAEYEAAKAMIAPAKTKQSGIHWEQIGVPDIIYTDEDEAGDAEGIYVNPQFKPDYSPALLAEDCYIRHLFIVRREIAAEVLDGMQQWCSLDDFAMRCARISTQILHIPKVLYHACRHTDTMHMSQEDTCTGTDDTGREKTERVQDQPLISIIIPNKDEQDSLKKCLASVAQSTYQNYEVVIVENNSTDSRTFEYYEKIQKENARIRVVHWTSDGTFNYSAINNCGVSCAKGEYLVFLNNDIELCTPDWLEAMLEQCSKERVAAVGAKLYYPDDTIQHAGIIVGIGGHARGVAANMCVGLTREKNGYMNRASVRQNMSAVTAALMMMKRSVFEEIGGFTERLTVAFNDVDLCLKARKAGWLIVYEPYVEAYHYESKSRGEEDTEEKLRRFQTEIEYMRTEWNDILREGDPYYNPNLTRYRADYSLRGR